MVETDIGEHEKIQAPGGVVLINEINLVSGSGVADVGETRRGSGAVFGVGEDGHHFIATLVLLPISNVHAGLGAKQVLDLGKPSRIAISVVTGDEVPNGLPSHELPHFHHPQTLTVAGWLPSNHHHLGLSDLLRSRSWSRI